MKTKLHYFLPLLIALNTSNVLSQTLDDLESEIENNSNNNTETLTIITKYQDDVENWKTEDQGRYYTLKGLELENIDIDSAEQNYNKSIEILEGLDFISEHLINALIERSYVGYLRTNDPFIYCPDRLRALELARQTSDYKETLARALVQYSFCFEREHEQFPKALKLLEEAIQITEKYKYNTSMIYNATAILYSSNKIYDRAYEYFIKAYKAWENNNDIQNMFNMQHALLNLSLNMGDTIKAHEHEKILLNLTQDNPSFKDFKFFSYFNAGMISYQEKDFSRAVENFENMLKLRDTTNEKYYVGIGLVYLAISSFRLNKMEEAKEYSSEYLAIYTGSKALKTSELMMDMIIDYTEKRHWQSVNKMWQFIDLQEKEKHLSFKYSSKAQSLIFDRSLNKFENKILAQENAINNLMLTSEKRKNRIALLTLTIIAVFSLSILLVTLSLWRSKKRFVRLAQIDFLTKISNRRHIFEAGQKLIDKTINNGQPLSLFLFDIDDFKKVNDEYGHDIGDKILIALANICSQFLPDNCLFGRFGGEEFIYLMPGLTKADALKIAERVRIKISQINLIENNQSINITISTGISISDQIVVMDELVKQADLAMYTSKESGKNRVSFYKLK